MAASPVRRFLVLAAKSDGICVRHVCRDTNWLPVSVTNPQSTVLYPSQVPASHYSNPPMPNQQIDRQPGTMDVNSASQCNALCTSMYPVTSKSGFCKRPTPRKLLKRWSGRRDSNPRRPAWENGSCFVFSDINAHGVDSGYGKRQQNPISAG